MSVCADNILDERPPRVMITGIGLDGHDPGARLIAAHLRDAGMDVVYTPPGQGIPAMVRPAIDEDIDVLGVSGLATDHLRVPKLMEALKAAGLAHVKVIVAGIVSERDERDLTAAGVSGVFHPGSSPAGIAETVSALALEARAEALERTGDCP